jgi:hypothetical protein
LTWFPYEVVSRHSFSNEILASKQPNIDGPPLLPINKRFASNTAPVLALRPVLKIQPVQVGFSPGAAERLADRMDIDLRQLDRLITAAFARALQANATVARVQAPEVFVAIHFNLATLS